jgi:hypothetical protein
VIASCKEYQGVEENCQKDREVDHGESNQVQKAQESEARSGIPQTEKGN